MRGWYVLEQDTILADEPEGEGPVADVRASFEYLCGLLGRSRGGGGRPSPAGTGERA